MAKLRTDEAQSRLADLVGWELAADGCRLVRRLRTRDFMAAVQLLNKLAELAEKLDHHPDFHLEGYRNVRIEVWTHSVGGLTERDFELARAIEELLKSHQSQQTFSPK